MDLPEASKEVVQVFAARGRLFCQRPQRSWDVSVIDMERGFWWFLYWCSVAVGCGTRRNTKQGRHLCTARVFCHFRSSFALCCPSGRRHLWAVLCTGLFFGRHKQLELNQVEPSEVHVLVARMIEGVVACSFAAGSTSSREVCRARVRGLLLPRMSD